MSDYRQITVWASGVIKDKEGRDVSNGLALAAASEGKFTQSFDNYVDLPDRVNVPLRKYCRISDKEIENLYEYENENPDVVVVIEAAIVKGINVLRGMKKGGILVVNTNRSPENILKFIPNKELLSKIACVDADGIVGLRTIDFSGSEGGIDEAGMGAGVASAVLGGVAKATGLVKPESVEKVVKNKEAARKGYDTTVVQAVN